LQLVEHRDSIDCVGTPTAVQIACALYVDRRLLPGQDPLEVQREIEGVPARLRRDASDAGALNVCRSALQRARPRKTARREFLHEPS
jgi:hypothetical protein